MWVICNPNQRYVGNKEELVPWLQDARIFTDCDEAAAEAKTLSVKLEEVLRVMTVGAAAYLDAEHIHKTHRKEMRERKAACSYLPYSRLFVIKPDCEDRYFGFDVVQSIYLAVRGAEIVGILGEADGNVVSIVGGDYDVFMEEYGLVPTCSDCGGRLYPDDEDEDEDDDGEAFDPDDFR